MRKIQFNNKLMFVSLILFFAQAVHAAQLDSQAMRSDTGLKLLQAYDGYIEAKNPSHWPMIKQAGTRVPWLKNAYETVKTMKMTIPAFIAKYGTIDAIKQNNVTKQELAQVIQIIKALGDNTYAKQLEKLQGQMAQEDRGAADAVAQVATFETQERQRTQAQTARDEQLARELQQREQQELLARQAQQEAASRKAAMVTRTAPARMPAPAAATVVRQQPSRAAAAAAPIKSVSFAEPLVQEQRPPAALAAAAPVLEEEVLELAQVAKQAAQLAEVAAGDVVALEGAEEAFGDFVSAEGVQGRVLVAPSVAEQSEVTGFMGRLGLKIQELKDAFSIAKTQAIQAGPVIVTPSGLDNEFTRDDQWGEYTGTPDNPTALDRAFGAAGQGYDAFGESRVGKAIGSGLATGRDYAAGVAERASDAFGSARDRAMNWWNGEEQSSEPITYPSRDATDSDAEARAMMAPYDAQEAAERAAYEQEGAVAAAQNQRAIDAEQRVTELDQLVNGPKGFADMRPVPLRVQQAAELRKARQELASAQKDLGIQDEPVVAAPAKKSSAQKLREGLRSEFGVGQRTAAQQANDARAAAEWQQALDDEAQLAADNAFVDEANAQGRKTWGTAPRWVNPRAHVDQKKQKDTKYLQEGRDAAAAEEARELAEQLDEQRDLQDQADAEFRAEYEAAGAKKAAEEQGLINEEEAALDAQLDQQRILQDDEDARVRTAYEKEGATAAAAEEARERGFFGNLSHNVGGWFGKGSTSDSSGEVTSEPAAKKQTWLEYLDPRGKKTSDGSGSSGSVDPEDDEESEEYKQAYAEEEAARAQASIDFPDNK